MKCSKGYLRQTDDYKDAFWKWKYTYPHLKLANFPKFWLNVTKKMRKKKKFTMHLYLRYSRHQAIQLRAISEKNHQSDAWMRPRRDIEHGYAYYLNHYSLVNVPPLLMYREVAISLALLVSVPQFHLWKFFKSVHIAISNLLKTDYCFTVFFAWKLHKFVFRSNFSHYTKNHDWSYHSPKKAKISTDNTTAVKSK